ncbi:uncharacterized protein [Parasteatoda tepidariorum]|nr:uncharacterized protein LOC107444298 isoform X2 [Parasteatoda tepidariorum]
MKKMNNLWITLLMCAVVEIYAAEDADHGEYGNNNLWRKTICEKNDESLFSEIDKCVDLQTKTIHEALTSCMKKVHPSSEGKYSLYLKEACNNVPLFLKIDDCMEQHKSLYKEVGIGEKALACLEETMKKHNLRELLEYYIDTESTEK